MRLPNLSVVAEDSSTVWTPITVATGMAKQAHRRDRLGDRRLAQHGTVPAVPLRWVLVRDPRAGFATQALLCTDLSAEPKQILSWFVMRWQLEATFQEARRHLGVETQRQWSEPAIRRTTPALLGLFSLVTLFAHRRMAQSADAVRQMAWYRKKIRPTFSDALALVRRELWTQGIFACRPRRRTR